MLHKLFSHNNFRVVVLVLYLVLIGVFSVVLIFAVAKKAFFLLDSSERVAQTTERSETTATESRNRTEMVKYWEVIDKNRGDAATGIKYFEEKYPYNRTDVHRWENYLVGLEREFYVSKSGGAFLGTTEPVYTLHTRIAGVRVYDTTSGESFVVPVEKNIDGEIWYTASQVVNDTLYFGVGGAFGPILSHKLEFSKMKQKDWGIEKFSMDGWYGERFEQYGGQYLSSFCYEGCSYSLVDLNKEVVVSDLGRMREADNGYDVSRSERYVGINNIGEVIVEVRGDNDEGFETLSISSFPLVNESVTNTVVNSLGLPEKELDYYMIDGSNKLVMIGKGVYVLDFQSKEVREIPVEEEVLNSLQEMKESGVSRHQIKNETLCFQSLGRKGVLFNIESETFSYLSGGHYCSDTNKPVSETFSQLGLDSYGLNEVEQVYSLAPDVGN